jgi:putative sugar O-methyltransferase
MLMHGQSPGPSSLQHQELKNVEDPVKFYSDSINHPSAKSFFAKYPIGVSWSLTIDVILRNLIFARMSPAEKIIALQKTYLYSIDQDDQFSKDLTLDCWVDLFKRRGYDLAQAPKELQESRYYDSKKLVSYEGRQYSLDFFSKLNLALDLQKHAFAGQERPTLLEVGGGYGQLARVQKMLQPNLRYVVFDLAETLYFSYIFLRLNFPNARIAWPTSPEEAQAELDRGDFDFCLIPCFFSENLTNTKLPFSAAVNKSSFGEMNNQSTEFYINLIQNKLNVATFFSLNRYLNAVDPDIQSYRFKENQWYNYLNNRWEIVQWEVEPDFTRFPYNEILHHRELYLIAKKSASPLEPQPLTDIYQQVWLKNFTLVPFARHSKVLVDDFKKGSVVERLANAIRLSPDEQNVDAMIKFVYLLEGKFPFEERFYYTDLYKKITGRKHHLSKPNPLLKYRIGKFFLTISGFKLVLNNPWLSHMILQGLGAIGINVKTTYDVLKRLLFNEKNK